MLNPKIKSFSISELLELTEDLIWSSQEYPKGMKLKNMSPGHLIHCIQYVQRRIVEKGDIISSRQKQFRYGEWLKIMCLRLVKVDTTYDCGYTYEELHESVNRIANNHGMNLNATQRNYQPTVTKTSMKLAPTPSKTTPYVVKPSTEPTPTPPSKLFSEKYSSNVKSVGALDSEGKQYFGSVTKATHARIKEIVKAEGSTISAFVTYAVTKYLEDYNKPTESAKDSPEETIKEPVYVCASNGKETEYAQVTIDRVEWTQDKSVVEPVAPSTALNIKNLFSWKDVFFQCPGFIITRSNEYLTRQEGWVTWTPTCEEADIFDNEQKAKEVIIALSIIFGAEECVDYVIQSKARTNQ